MQVENPKRAFFFLVLLPLLVLAAVYFVLIKENGGPTSSSKKQETVGNAKIGLKYDKKFEPYVEATADKKVIRIAYKTNLGPVVETTDYENKLVQKSINKRIVSLRSVDAVYSPDINPKSKCVRKMPSSQPITSSKDSIGAFMPQAGVSQATLNTSGQTAFLTWNSTAGQNTITFNKDKTIKEIGTTSRVRKTVLKTSFSYPDLELSIPKICAK